MIFDKNLIMHYQFCQNRLCGSSIFCCIFPIVYNLVIQAQIQITMKQKLIWFPGKNRVRVPCDIYWRVCDEDHSVWIRDASGVLLKERMEFTRLHHRCYRVSHILKRMCSFLKIIYLGFYNKEPVQNSETKGALMPKIPHCKNRCDVRSRYRSEASSACKHSQRLRGLGCANNNACI